MLQLYETLGWWKSTDPEDHAHGGRNQRDQHLRIMESLGGNLLWWNRFIRYTGPAYYVLLILFYIVSPNTRTYRAVVGRHAVYTYTVL